MNIKIVIGRTNFWEMVSKISPPLRGGDEGEGEKKSHYPT